MINNCECAIFASCGGGKAEIVKVCFLLRYNVIEMKGRRLSVGENTRIPFIVELCSTRSIFYHHSFDDVWPSKFMKIKQRLVALQITSVIQYNELLQSVSEEKLWYVIHVPINVIQRPNNVFGSLKLLHCKYEFPINMCDSCNCVIICLIKYTCIIGT